MINKSLLRLIAFVVSSLIPMLIDAQPSQTISYQGTLTKPDGPYLIIASFYTHRSDSIPVCSDTQTINLVNGVFATEISVSAPLNIDSTYYLGFRIDTEPELLQRMKLGPVPRAFTSRTSGSLSGTVAIPRSLYPKVFQLQDSAFGDLEGLYPNPTITKLLRSPVSPQKPAIGNVLVWDGTTWMPTSKTSYGSDCHVGNPFLIQFIRAGEEYVPIFDLSIDTLGGFYNYGGCFSVDSSYYRVPLDGYYSFTFGITAQVSDVSSTLSLIMTINDKVISSQSFPVLTSSKDIQILSTQLLHRGDKVQFIIRPTTSNVIMSNVWLFVVRMG